jgi:UDP-N-acetylglucosamine acyltransferase
MNNTIHPTAIVSPKAMIGSSNTIGPYCVIHDNVEIGSNNIFTSHVSVGSPAEHKNADRLTEGVVIGDHNIFREFITINQGTMHPTKISNHGFFMRGCHIGHDAVIENHVTMACNSIVGGHAIVMQKANIGLGAILHQNIIIAPLAMIGMGTVVTKKSIIELGKTYAGNPAKLIGENKVGIERSELSKKDLSDLETLWIATMVKKRMTP